MLSDRDIIILHILSFNWSAWFKLLKDDCLDQFGTTGTAILNNQLSTLSKIISEDDVDIKGDRIYPLDETTKLLTDRAFQLFIQDKKRQETFHDRQIVEDNLCLTRITSTIHSTSSQAVRNHTLFKKYLLLPHGNRATSYLKILQLIHSTSDAATKNSRALKYFSNVFSNSIGESIENVSLDAAQFKADWESEFFPGCVELADLHCFVLFQTITGENYRNFWDNYLTSHPNRRHSDPLQLAADITAWDTLNRNTFTTDSPSTQGQSYITTPSFTSHAPKPDKRRTNSPSNPSSTSTPKPHCPSCFIRVQQKYNNHGVPGKPPCRWPISPLPTSSTLSPIESASLLLSREYSL